MKATVIIEYSPQYNWLLRAADLAREFLTTFENDLKAFTVQAGEVYGDFPISNDGKKIFDGKGYGGFPESKELKQPVRGIAAPGKSPGHANTKHIIFSYRSCLA